MYERKILLAFARVHILHHADQEGIYGAWMIQELKNHGYKISPGTLYPILHEMEQKQLLTVQETKHDGKIRKIYTTTDKGKQTLQQLQNFIKELQTEVLP